jgi:natural product precursor
MKTKKFNKKLGLNKTTISNLSNNQMRAMKGGVQTDYPCVSNPTSCDDLTFIPHKCPPPTVTETEGPQFTCLTFFGCK